jgi:hypothetical protein
MATTTPAHDSLAMSAPSFSASSARPRSGGATSGSPSARMKISRAVCPRAAAQHLLRADEDRLNLGQHLEVLHEHLREVRLAVARLADERRDGRRRGRRGRPHGLDERAQQLVTAHERRDAHARRRLLRGLRRLLEEHDAGPVGTSSVGASGSTSTAAAESKTPGGSFSPGYCSFFVNSGLW